MKEKILEKISEELFFILLRLKNAKVCSINTLLLIKESLKTIESIENDKDEEECEKFDITKSTNDMDDGIFDEVFSIYNRLLWIKCNYVNAGY